MKINFFQKKRKGIALLGLVLVSFIALSIFSLVLFGISLRILKVETWESKHYDTLRLSYLARSTANAVVEAISDDTFPLDTFPITNKHGETIISGVNPTTISVDVRGNSNSNLIVKAEAISKAKKPADKDQSVAVTIKYNNSTKKITQQWREDK